MMSNRNIPQTVQLDNPLWLSWHDTQMIASLNPQTVMDYFCRKSNPFYDNVCNNETIRMQRSSLDNLTNMTGVEYILLHVSEPNLYVIRKQHRYSPNDTTPLANYYIIDGVVYKAPDLASVINSRILAAISNLQSAFDEARSYSRYHPSKGYTWDFSTNKALSSKSKLKLKRIKTKNKDESATAFQTQRVDMLLAELVRKFPPPLPNSQSQKPSESEDSKPVNSSSSDADQNPNIPVEIKTESIDMKPPPEKKSKS